MFSLLARLFRRAPADLDRCKWCKKLFGVCLGGASSDFPELCSECCTNRRPHDFIARVTEQFPRSTKRWIGKMKSRSFFGGRNG